MKATIIALSLATLATPAMAQTDHVAICHHMLQSYPTPHMIIEAPTSR